MACILVVEDESDVRDVLVDAISDEGYSTVAAARGCYEPLASKASFLSIRKANAMR